MSSPPDTYTLTIRTKQANGATMDVTTTHASEFAVRSHAAEAIGWSSTVRVSCPELGIDAQGVFARLPMFN